MQKDKIEKLAKERSQPCVTISMNTPQEYPNNQHDFAELKKLIQKAREKVIKDFGQYQIVPLLEKIDNLELELDFSSNLSSFHLFLSDSTKEIVISSWPVLQNVVSVTENFLIKPLIKDFNRMEAYLILALSQTEVKLLHAINEVIVREIKDDEFPFDENPHFLTDQDKSSDAKQVDNMVREFFNHIDKAVVKIHNKTNMNVVVICTEKNWSRLMQVADKPSIYYGNISRSFKDATDSTLSSEAFKIVNARQEKSRTKVIQEMKDAAGHGKVLTDLSDIYQAVKEGRGELLIVKDDYSQAVKMTGEFSFTLEYDVTQPEVITDITSEIVWEVISKKGRAIFTNQEELNSLGNIALKLRY